jgi:hypothetical protein
LLLTAGGVYSLSLAFVETAAAETDPLGSAHMIWVALLIGVVLVGRWVVKRGLEPVPYRTRLHKIVDRYLPNLVGQAPRAQFFIAERISGPGFLQVAVTDARNSWCSLEFGLPDAEWARDNFDEVDRVLRSHSFVPQIEEGSTDAVPRFLRLTLTGPAETVIPQMGQVLSLVASGLGWDAATDYILRYNAQSAA